MAATDDMYWPTRESTYRHIILLELRYSYWLTNELAYFYYLVAYFLMSGLLPAYGLIVSDGDLL